MTDRQTKPATFDERTTDHETIKTWVEGHGGEPIVIQDGVDGEIDLTFDLESPVEKPIDWRRFFEYFDEKDLVFAYRDPRRVEDIDAAYAFFHQRRVETSNRLNEKDDDEPAAGGPLDDDALADDARASPDRVGDGRSNVRHEAATDQENADNHRDEPPFNS